MKIKKIIFILTVLILTGCNSTKELTAQDDYYDYINQKLLNEKEIEEGEYLWSTFKEAQDNSDDDSKEIIKKLRENNTNSNLNIIYNQLNDITTRNQTGIKDLEPYLEKIDSITTIQSFIETAIDIENALNIDIFTNITINSDFKNTNENIVYLEPVTFSFGTSADYYINENYMAYKALIKKYGIKILKQYGYTKEKAREVSTNITNMYNDVASKSLLAEDLEDVSKYYNIITKEELQKIYTNLDIDYYLKKKKISSEEKISIVDTGNYQAINSYLTDENVPILKEVVKLKILETYASYLSENYSNLITELNNKLTGTTIDNKTTEEKNNDIIASFFSYDIDNYYQENNFSNEKKEYIKKMIDDILEYYKKDIKNIAWLSSETIKKAELKLENMNINIGLNKEYPEYSKEYNLSNSNTLIENIIKMSNTIKDYELSKLKTNKKEQSLSQTTVNAYYSPSDNSINFTVASAQLFNLDDNYYQNLGSIGMIIAHEITHAFDSNGSKFDETGNMINWWTEEDLLNYEKLQNEVIEYYNQFEVLDGEYINGKKTVNENIADLKAVSCITDIALEKQATNKELKQMYKSFATMWASKSTEEYQKLLLLQDVHAPAKYRVNATLSSIDTFYEIYNIRKKNKMYISTKDRIEVW